MKKFLIFLIFPITTVLGQYQVISDVGGVLQFPSASDFKEANAIPNLGGYQINIDTTQSVNAYDATETKKISTFIARNADLNMGASTSGGWANVSATKGSWQASKGGWSCYYVNNYDLTGDTQAASLGITYAVALASEYISGVPITQQFYNNKIDLSPYAGRRVKIAYSFYAKKIYDGSVTLALATLGTSSTNLTNIKTWNSQLVLNSWVKLVDTIYYTVPARTDGAVQRIGFVATKADNGSVALANFSFQVFEEAEYSVPKNTDWTDGEFKILDADGNLIYWVSTQWGAQMGGEYESNPATDLNAKIFYTSPENEANGSGKGREWIEYVHNNTNARTIYEHAKLITRSATPTISGIVIQPDWSNGDVKTAFKNGKSFIHLKCSPTSIEKTKDGLPVWRAIVPQQIQ